MLLIRAICFSKVIFGSEGVVTIHIRFVRSDNFLVQDMTPYSHFQDNT